MARIKVFGTDMCPPCRTLKQLIEANGTEDVEFIDITTEEGYKWVTEFGFTEVPAAAKNGKLCEIVIDESEHVTFICD